jgi:hypothetical protein
MPVRNAATAKHTNPNNILFINGNLATLNATNLAIKEVSLVDKYFTAP